MSANNNMESEYKEIASIRFGMYVIRSSFVQMSSLLKLKAAKISSTNL